MCETIMKKKLFHKKETQTLSRERRSPALLQPTSLRHKQVAVHGRLNHCDVNSSDPALASLSH